MIKTFENFNELDPYDEENWNDDVDITLGSMIYVNRPFEISLKGGDHDDFYGRVVGKDYLKNLTFEKTIFGKEPTRWQRNILYIKNHINNGDLRIVPFFRIEESINELDPYNEEDWNVDEPKPKKKPFKRDRCPYCDRVLQWSDKRCPECKTSLDEYWKEEYKFQKWISSLRKSVNE